MARQPRTINLTARTGGANLAHALSQLERVTNVVRASDRVSRAAASVARARGHRWELPAQDWLAKDNQVVETRDPANRGTAADGSESDFGARPSGSGTGYRSKTARAGSAWQRAAAMVDNGARWSREIPEISHAMDALSRAERSVETGSAARAISEARKFAPSRVALSVESSRARERLEATRPSPAATRALANVRVARSIRGVTQLPSISQREFARPSSDVRASNDGSGRAGITINSSPTVVINAPAGGAVQHDVLGALRAHREELFDQLKRESARRERAQF
jgi:hypothetical protein